MLKQNPNSGTSTQYLSVITNKRLQLVLIRNSINEEWFIDSYVNLDNHNISFCESALN